MSDHSAPTPAPPPGGGPSVPAGEPMTGAQSLIKALAEEIGRARTPTVYGRPSLSPSPYGKGVARSGPLVLSRSL